MNFQSFDELSLSPLTLEAIEAAGYKTPTPIQTAAVPALLSGRDVILQAQTGTGKTAAFVLPIVERLNPVPGTISVLVLAPTRELALQVSDEFNRFGRNRGIESAAIYGGTSFNKQFEALRTANVVVATPGRLLDLYRRKRVTFNKVEYFGLDESDEMLSLGFDRDVLEIAKLLPAAKQCFLCSATYNDEVKRIAGNFIQDPLIVNVSSDEIGAHSVRHVFYELDETDKIDALRRLVAGAAETGALIFGNTRAATFRICDALLENSILADVLNGELSQAERELALERMKNDEVKFLVCTDVAARGIDISGLPAVINFDLPESADVYIHRTGRTGRAGQAGVAYSLVTPADIAVHHSLEKFYKLEIHRETIPTTADIRSMRADRVLDSTLASFDNRSLSYGESIPLAKRLLERDDRVRYVAKLIAALTSRATNLVAPEAAELTSRAIAPVEAAAPESAETPESRSDLDARDEARHSSRPERHRRDDRSDRPRRDDSARPPRTESDRSARDSDRPPRDADRAPREPRQREDRVERAPIEAAPSAAPELIADNGDLSTADRLFNWMTLNPNRAEKGWREGAVLAEAAGTTNEDVQSALRDDERFEPSQKFVGNWRLRRPPASALSDGPRPERAAEPARSERPAEATRRDRPAASPAAERAPRDARPSNRKPAPAAEPRPAKRPDRPERPERSDRGGDRRRGRDARRPSEPLPPLDMIRPGDTLVALRCGLGSARIKDIADFREKLAHGAGLDVEDFPKIDVASDHSLIHVKKDLAQDILDALANQTYANVPLKLHKMRPKRDEANPS